MDMHFDIFGLVHTTHTDYKSLVFWHTKYMKIF